jgi:hypothetical protein
MSFVGNPTDASTRNVDLNGVQMAPKDYTADDSNPLDDSWAKLAFMVPDDEYSSGAYRDLDVANRYWSSAMRKYTDTTPGGAFGINAPPQWTQYADIPEKGKMPGRADCSIGEGTGNFGMGRAYSESIDDGAQRVYMRFGVPQFNGLGNFLLKAFSRHETILARTGRAPSAWYKVSSWLGTAFSVAYFPGFAVLMFIGNLATFSFKRPTSKFFTVKPTMYLYWNVVNQLCLNHMVNEGMIPRIVEDGKPALGGDAGRPMKLDKSQMETFHDILPDIFVSTGIKTENPEGRYVFDIFSMATKSQRYANAQFEEEYKNILMEGDAEKFQGYLIREAMFPVVDVWITRVKKSISLFDHLNSMLMWGKNTSWHMDDSEAKASSAEHDPRIDGDGGEDSDEYRKAAGTAAKEGQGVSENPVGAPKGDLGSIRDFVDAEFRDGASFACFQVDYTASVNESFSNSAGESELASKLNSTSSQFREARFTIGDGNFVGTGDGIIANTLQGIVTTAKKVVDGALDGATFGISGLIFGLAGSGYIDIPKHWQSSTANLPRGNYTIKLRSPYGNGISRMINIWIPFYMILAACLPRSTGKQSYTHPFYCQFFDRGRVQSKCAMVESLSINRGTSNLAYNAAGKALAIDITLTIVDLSTILHMPLGSGSLVDFSLLGGGSDVLSIDEDQLMADYLAVLSSMDIYSQIYSIPKAQIRLSKLLFSAGQKWNSPAWKVAAGMEAITNGFVNDLTFGLSGFLVDVMKMPVQGSSQLKGVISSSSG